MQESLWTLTCLVIAAGAYIWLNISKHTDIAKEPTPIVKIEVPNKVSNLAILGKQAFLIK